jgi:hypothetical protein
MTKLIYSMIFAGAAIFSLVVVTSVGCGSPDQLGKGGEGGGVAGNVTIKLDGSLPGVAGSGGGGYGASGAPPTGDANCGSQTSSTTHEPADVLLVLDRSGSMDYSIAEECYCDPSLATGSGTRACSDTANCTTRWSSLSSAIKATLAQTQDIRWGLKLFSTPNSRDRCTVSNGVEVGIADNSASALQAQVDAVDPSNNTPTAKAIQAATAYLQTLTDPNNKVILLSTDGEPNCKADGNSGDPDVDGTEAAIKAARAAGFLVYVVGIGPSVTNLDRFAAAGGTTTYYKATSSEGLAEALAAISTAVVTCTFTLANVPPDVNNVAVYLDKKLVAQDPTNGWSFGGNTQTIVLNGTTCDLITSGQASTVQVLFGCPGVAPPLFIP